MRKLPLFLWIILALLPSAFANTDQALRKAGRAAQSLAQGNTEGALYQALPNARLPVNNTSLYANTRRVGVSQPIIPAQKLGGVPYYLNGSYNASVPVSARPRPNQNVSVGVNGQRLSNRTSFSLDP
jgi:hypothetical protein